MHSPKRTYLVTFRPKHPKWDQNLQTTSTRVTLVWESPPGKQITICSTWFFVRSMITVSWEYWLCFTQFRLRWMTGFMVGSNGVLLTFVYFYQLGEIAWTSTLYFLTFTEVARFEINVETLLFACANFFINWLWYKCSLGLRTVPGSVKSKSWSLPIGRNSQ